MTLILTCLTKDYVVQASDRRLSYWDGKKVVIDDDDSNKVLIYEKRSRVCLYGAGEVTCS